MKLANQPALQEVMPRQTSSLCPTYSAIGAASLRAQAVVGRAVVVLPGLQPLTSSGRASGRESRRKTVVLLRLFPLEPVRGRKSESEDR